MEWYISFFFHRYPRFYAEWFVSAAMYFSNRITSGDGIQAGWKGCEKTVASKEKR